MSLFKFRNGSKSLFRFRAISGFFKVLINKKDNTTGGTQLRNKMSVKYEIRGE